MICHGTSEGGCIVYSLELENAVREWVKSEVKKAFNYMGGVSGSDGWWTGKFHYHAPEDDDTGSDDTGSEDTGSDESGSESVEAGHWCWGGTRFTSQARSLKVSCDNGVSVTATLVISVTDTGRTYHDE